MTINQAAGAFTNNFGVNLATLAVTNVTIGDYRLVSVEISSVSFTATGVSGGGVTTWTKIVEGTENTNYLAVFGGVVTATGAQTISVTYSSVPGVNCELWSSELVWSGGVPSSWTPRASGVLANTSSTTVTFPSLVSASGTDQAYFGFCSVTGNAIAGSSSGFTYSTVNGNGNLALFNGTLAASTAYQPICTQDTTGVSGTNGVIVQVNVAASPTGNLLAFC